MTVLTNTIVVQDLVNWASLSTISTVLYVTGKKILTSANDPLITPALLTPEADVQISG